MRLTRSRGRTAAAALVLGVVTLALAVITAAAASPPAHSELPAAVLAVTATPTQPSDDPGETVYVVKAGDSLARIAARFRTTPEQLLEINSLTNPRDIFVGQALRITPSFGPTTDLQGNPIDCQPSGPALPAAEETAAEAAVIRPAGAISQTFQLQPGWNAVFLEVQPDPQVIGEALAGIPVACVYSHLGQPDRKPAAYHRGAPEASNLYALHANQAYLVKLEGDDPIQWTVYGRPLVQETAWAADRLVETGLHVDTNTPPTFGQFFEPSTSHASFRAFRLDRGGRWDPVSDEDVIQPGQAYRIYSEERSSYDGPLYVSTDLGDELQFGRTLTERSLHVANVTDQPKIVSIRVLDAPSPVPLSYAVFDPQAAGLRWQPLNGEIRLPQDVVGEKAAASLAPGEAVELRLAVRRADLPAGVDSATSVLEIRDGEGSRRLVTVSAQPRIASAAEGDTAARSAASAAAATTAAPNQLAGLWIGSVVVDHVSVANRIKPDLYFDLELAVLSDRLITETVTGPDGLTSISATVQTARDVAVPVGSDWRYLSGETPGAGWTQADFDDSTWAVGEAALGFGNRPVVTEIDPVDSAVIFFRQAFTLPVTLDQSDLELRLRRDDGAVVYLNGVEVLRSNMTESLNGGPEPAARIAGAGETGFEVFSSEGTASSSFSHADPADLLMEGVNVLAVEVHQYVGEQGVSGGAILEPTASEFRFRVLIHVDESGEARLLKEAILMRDPVSGEDVLLTDSSRIREFTGAGMRDGRSVGRRASTAAYDFAGDDATMPGTLLLSGGLAPGNTLSALIELTPNFPTNPFKHRYHPDHDNLQDGVGTVLPDDLAETYAIVREIEFAFGSGEEAQAGEPGWGDSLLRGAYNETLQGLHREPLMVRGNFLLRRASNVTTLNPDPGQAQ